MFDGDERVVGQRETVNDSEQVVVAGEFIRRIGVDDGGRLPVAGCQDVGADSGDWDVPFFRQLLDRGDVLLRRVDRCRVGGAAGDGLKRKDAGSGEEVEEVSSVDLRADDVEERLPRALGGGADVVRRNGDAAAAERPRGDAQRVYLADLLPMK